MRKARGSLKFLVPILGFLFWLAPARAESGQLNIYLFQSDTCPHCQKEEEFLAEIAPKYPKLTINSYEITNNIYNLRLMTKVAEKLGAESGAVPFLVIGSETILGFGSPETTGVQIQNSIEKALESHPKDVVAEVLKENPDIKAKNTPIAADRKEIDEVGESEKPFFELKLDLESLPLPLFTFVIALMDGFNPCAMWVLLFLISILLGTKDRKKMWILGGVFILSSGFMYFLFLAAWLNFFLLIGYAVAVRYIVGIFAIGLGVYYLYDYHKNRGGCVVSQNEKRKNLLEKIKKVILERSLIAAAAGMAILAVAVNLIELLCSAGLPAVFTKVLSMNSLPTFQYYLYLLFYIFVFMLDDMVVFVGAMITLEAFGIKNKYAKYSHLVGGVIVFLIGLALIFRPELLSFK
ncbi:MAG: membrane protein [Patescibacteria group bacterium]|nr:MAG: membrane protein [Patescibacteria group bacterium]